MYNKHSPEFRFTVAKDAISHGPRPTAKKYGLSESTVRGFVKSFKESQNENPNTQLEKEKKMRESGSVVNYNIIRAIATGISLQTTEPCLKKMVG